MRFAHLIFINLLVLVCYAQPAEKSTRAGDVVVEPPTLICAGFQWKIEGDANRNASVEVAFRKEGDASW